MRQFVRRLRGEVRPGQRLPDVFYDAPALGGDVAMKVSMRAKCVMAASRRTLFTSAKLTEAAQDRNIRPGVGVNVKQFE